MKFTALLVFLFFAFNISLSAQNLEKLTYQELDSIGLDLLDKEEYKKAEKYFKVSLSKIETEFGKKDTLYAQTKTYLANVYLEDLRYSEAETLFIEAKEINKKTVGENHQNYALSCLYLAKLYSEYTAAYTKAEPLYLEAKSIYEKLDKKEDDLYSDMVRGLANIYSYQFLNKKAETIYLELKAIQEKKNNKGEFYAIICQDLGNLYLVDGQLEKAEPFYLEAMAIYEKEFGQQSQYYALICSNMAILYEYLEMYEKSEMYYKKAIKIGKKVYGKDSPTHGMNINNIGNFYYIVGKNKKAEKYYKKALVIYENVIGKEHPDYDMAAANLAILYQNQKLYQKADFYYEGVINSTKKRIQLLFPTLSEEEKQIYFSEVDYVFEYFTDFASDYYPLNNKISQDLFNQQLFTKGIIFSSTQKMKKQILNSKDDKLITQYENWIQQKENYVNLLQTPLKERDKDTDITKLATDINELEREISKKSESFKQNANQKEYKWQEVREALQENEAVVEMIHLLRYDSNNEPKDTVYVALIVTKETLESPLLLVLENGQELENGVFNFYQNNIDFQLENEESYNQYWKPIQDKLDALSNKGYSKIYFSPDGIYHKVNLNTLFNSKTKKYLLEEQNIRLITSSRDLIERKEKGIENVDLSKNFANYKAYLLGYPSYNLNGKDTLKVNGTDRSLNGLQRVIGQQTVIPVLEGTKVETNEINTLLNQKSISTTLFQNNEATEENIKALKNPTILHFATHGFFINEITTGEPKTLQEAEDRSLLANPFLRSGLLLAGCQNPQTGKEDGILSAEEAMNLNLDETELVVLSACETGLGDVHNGEGVYGLQRAFRQAGAKTIIMSLWKVSDEATQLLMTTFYENLLSGKSKREAFKIAQLKLKEKYTEPFYWGAFVMVGE